MDSFKESAYIRNWLREAARSKNEINSKLTSRDLNSGEVRSIVRIAKLKKADQAAIRRI